MLSTFVNEHFDDWDEHLPYLLMAYRATIHSSTGCRPNLLMLGREVVCSLDLMVGLPPNTSGYCPSMYVNWLQNSTRKTFEFAHQNLGIATSRQIHCHDRGLKPRVYNVGDFVWRWYPPDLACKLGQGWTGPYKVIRKLTGITCEVKKTPGSNRTTVHVDHLKPYQGETIPTSWTEESNISGPAVVGEVNDRSEREEAESTSTPAEERVCNPGWACL